MKAMVLAAGRGKRMRPLTDNMPKPLLKAGGIPLLQHHIQSLAESGFADIVINHARFGEQIEAYFGDGADFGVSIRYSAERERPLETGGGILRALPLLGTRPFLVINGDTWTDYDFSQSTSNLPGLGHVILVNNPAHNKTGDFGLRNGSVTNEGGLLLTYSGIAVLHPDLFLECQEPVFSLTPLLRNAAENNQLSGEYYPGHWFDAGTPERLAALDAFLTD